MKTIINRYQTICMEQGFILSSVNAFIMLLGSFIIMNYAGTYAFQVASNPVSDLLLDYIPLYNVTFFHINAAISFWMIFSTYILTQPTFIPFTLKAAALFVVVRSGFICLTHLGVPTNHLVISNVSSLFLFKGDLFFSGHVGGPFLMMLIFWKNLPLRYICLTMALFFAYIVLIGHIHYSIDVFAAPFITYGIFHLSQFLFLKDYQLLQTSIDLSETSTTQPSRL